MTFSMPSVEAELKWRLMELQSQLYAELQRAGLAELSPQQRTTLATALREGVAQLESPPEPVIGLDGDQPRPPAQIQSGTRAVTEELVDTLRTFTNVCNTGFLTWLEREQDPDELKVLLTGAERYSLQVASLARNGLQTLQVENTATQSTRHGDGVQ